MSRLHLSARSHPAHAHARAAASWTTWGAGVLAVCLLVLGGACAEAPLVGPSVPARVMRVVDGDTVDVEVGGRRVRVRLIGVDTPETHRPATPVECFGPEAAARLAELLPDGTEVDLERDVEPEDRFHRTLGYLRRRQDGLFVNAAMVAGGHATDFAHPPNTRHADQLAVSAGEARLAGRGLWGACRGPHVPADTGVPTPRSTIPLA